MNITPVDLVLLVAAKSEGASEIPADTNSGPYVERVLRRVGLKKGKPWCAAEVADTGALALGSVWPLPLTGGCQVLYEFARKRAVVYDTPERGDVFLIWHPELERFAHTGFVTSVNPDGTCNTREGNTSGGGSREGWIVSARGTDGSKPRRFAREDRFIRWRELVRGSRDG